VPAAASASTSATTSAKGRLISTPRTDGTMQKAQALSHPIWIVTHAEWARSRRTGRADGKASDSARISRTGPSSAARLQQLDGPTDVVGAEHHVDERRPLLDRGLVLLGEAPGDGDLHAGPRPLQRLQLTEVAVQLVVGVLPDAARVEDDHVGAVDVGHLRQPVGLEQAGDALGVVHVHLAPVGAHGVGASRSAAPGLRRRSVTPARLRARTAGARRRPVADRARRRPSRSARAGGLAGRRGRAAPRSRTGAPQRRAWCRSAGGARAVVSGDRAHLGQRRRDSSSATPSVRSTARSTRPALEPQHRGGQRAEVAHALAGVDERAGRDVRRRLDTSRSRRDGVSRSTHTSPATPWRPCTPGMPAGTLTPGRTLGRPAGPGCRRGRARRGARPRPAGPARPGALLTGEADDARAGPGHREGPCSPWGPCSPCSPRSPGRPREPFSPARPARRGGPARHARRGDRWRRSDPARHARRAGPGAPCTPLSPCSPRSPGGPTRPGRRGGRRPCSPARPGRPVEPWMPFSPGRPVGPSGPCAPLSPTADRAGPSRGAFSP
jgi:hypothetical protein